MKVLCGKQLNLFEEVVGRITYGSPEGEGRKDEVLVVHDVLLPVNVSGYAAAISGKSVKGISDITIPLLYEVDNFECLNEGDIILMTRDGKIVMLYEMRSAHNALLLTNRCNFSCLMCPQEIVSHESDKTEQNLKIISLIDKNTKTLGITGGEPTLLGEKFFEILSACKQHLPETEIDLLSNGISFYDFEFAKRLALLQHPKLTICIPLYGDTDYSHDRIVQAKSFYKIIKGLYNLALFSQKIEIRIVLHSLTYARLKNIAEFIYHNFPFVVHVAFMGMEIRASAHRNLNTLWVEPNDYVIPLKDAVQYLHRRDMSVSIYNIPLCHLPEELWPFSVRSISDWKQKYLDVCYGCTVKDKCCGLFDSVCDEQSQSIRPLTEIL